MSKDKSKVKTFIGYIIRTLRLLSDMSPRFFIYSVINAIAEVLQPLVVLFGSARILNELAGNMDLKTIIVYVALTVSVSFMLSLLRTLTQRKLNISNDAFISKVFHCWQEGLPSWTIPMLRTQEPMIF
jgi:ATP-binding cassette subfamily B protein